MSARLPTVVAVVGLALLPGCDARPRGPANAVRQQQLLKPAASAAEATQTLDELLRLMRQRLLLMHEVARWKWDAKKPVADPDREQELLKKMAATGAGFGLDPELTAGFFAAQIEAARLIQQADFGQWRREGRGPFGGAADLEKTLRPQIDDVSFQLAAALYRLGPFLDDAKVRQEVRPRAVAILTGDGITDAVRDAAIAPLLRAPAR